MKYIFTEAGKKNAEDYLAELNAKRKEILDAGLDTVEEYDCAKLTIEDLLDDAIAFGFDDDGEAYDGFFVTDHYDADRPFCFKLGRDIIAVDEGVKSRNWKQLFPDWQEIEPGDWSTYGMIINIGNDIKLEIGLYHEPENSGEYSGTYTLQFFCNDDVLLCERCEE